MAKSAPGWLVPAVALFAIIVWERRWREFLRWELYFGFIVQALLIGPWIYQVSRVRMRLTRSRRCSAQHCRPVHPHRGSRCARLHDGAQEFTGQVLH